MVKIDFNCFVGGWPFHKVRNHSFESILELHEQNEISGGYISSTNAIFYNDPYEAELELAAVLSKESYHHVMTVNPTLPGCFDDITRAIRDLRIEGIRILPGFHNYSLNSEEVTDLCMLLRRYRLPLFLTLRMEDERVAYLFHPQSVPIQDVKIFLESQTELPVLLCNARLGELLKLKDILLTHRNKYADCSGLKDMLFIMEHLNGEHLTERLVYGSLAPIFCLKSSLLSVEVSDIAPETKASILSGTGFYSALQTYKTNQIMSVL